MTQTRTIEQKVGDATAVFNALRAELTPEPIRALVTQMTTIPVTETTDIAAYAAMVQASLHLARVVSANDRTAMIAAAMLTQSGVSRPTFNPDEEA